MEYTGWLGAVIFIVAYLLLSLEYISAKNYLYHILNALGAICLVLNAVLISDYPNIFVNAVWGLIAFLAIYKRSYSDRKASTSKIQKP